jgi:hypothetical protein
MTHVSREGPDPLAKTLWARDRRRRLRNGLRVAVMFGPLLLLGRLVTKDGAHLAGRVASLVLITAAFTLFVMAAVLGFLWPPPNRGLVRDGTLILRHSIGYRLVLPATLAIPGGVLVAREMLQPTPDLAGAAGLLALMVLPVGLLAIAFRATVEVAEAGVAHRSPWSGKRKVIAWSDLTALESDAFRALVLRGPGKTTIKANLALEGLPELASTVRTRVRAEGIAASPAALDILDALAAHPALHGEDGGERGGRVQAWLSNPLLTIPASLILGGFAFFALRLANTPLPEPIFSLPAGWIAGVPAELAGTPLGGGSGFLSVAHEPVTEPRPGRPAVPPGQLFWAELADGELDAERAARNLGDRYLARYKERGREASEVRLREHAVTKVSGVEAARIEIEEPSEGQHFILYVVPLGGRIGFLNYTCAASECDRLRPEFERAAGATQGLSGPSYRGSPESRRDLAAAGVIALFASVLLGGEALVALARRAATRLRPERR